MTEGVLVREWMIYAHALRPYLHTSCLFVYILLVVRHSFQQSFLNGMGTNCITSLYFVMFGGFRTSPRLAFKLSQPHARREQKAPWVRRPYVVVKDSVASERSSFQRESNTRLTTWGDPYPKFSWASGKSVGKPDHIPDTNGANARYVLPPGSWRLVEASSIEKPDHSQDR